LTFEHLRAGRGSLDLRVEGTDFEVVRNDSGFEVVRGAAPGRVPEEPT
jgi:hypothetical protein